MAAGLAAVLASAAVCAPPARAAFAGSYVCAMTMNLAAGTGTTSCIGTFTGPTDGGTRTVPLEIYVDYDETACPVAGTAAGMVLLDSQYFSDIAYVRVGIVVLPVLTGGHSGMSVAAFVIDTADLVRENPQENYCYGTDVQVTLAGVLTAV